MCRDYQVFFIYLFNGKVMIFVFSCLHICSAAYWCDLLFFLHPVELYIGKNVNKQSHFLRLKVVDVL